MSSGTTKLIRLSHHARGYLTRRGFAEAEVRDVIRTSRWRPTRGGRWEALKEFPPVYRCPCCGEPTISFGQKAWVCYIGRSTTCRRCGGSVGISTILRYLTNAPLLLYVIGLFLYLETLSDQQLRTRQTFWLFVVAILIVPTIYGLLMAAFRVWLVPLVRR